MTREEKLAAKVAAAQASLQKWAESANLLDIGEQIELVATIVRTTSEKEFGDMTLEEFFSRPRLALNADNMRVVPRVWNVVRHYAGRHGRNVVMRDFVKEHPNWYAVKRAFQSLGIGENSMQLIVKMILAAGFDFKDR